MLCQGHKQIILAAEALCAIIVAAGHRQSKRFVQVNIGIQYLVVGIAAIRRPRGRKCPAGDAIVKRIQLPVPFVELHRNVYGQYQLVARVADISRRGDFVNVMLSQGPQQFPQAEQTCAPGLLLSAVQLRVSPGMHQPN